VHVNSDCATSLEFIAVVNAAKVKKEMKYFFIMSLF